MVTPGVKPLPHQIQDEQNLLDSEQAAEEICRFMAKRSGVALASLKRLAGYFNAKPRMVFDLPFQQADSIEMYSDTDWAGCHRTRTSASGGRVLLGWHAIKC